MAQTKIKDIRELTTEELTRSLRDLKQEALNLRLQQATGQLENTARRRLVRRETARVQTVLSERRNQQG
ncbi:50S ribosomal protein L29 [Verrucomicrobiaceae bacterium N1E253]|uniref:Large ribosomal subunit protein uL29 n=1 Tax=Oceaniferula marina TaxID=2748318 RepID=A0A851GGU1_9BACT|nr:50S ribosomal protein L29 [Oceaniferula marina]NWK56112.1 50S ribosomal protein L29 [Oceaniferula marina]